MERIPFYRRPIFIILALLLTAAIVYDYFLNRIPIPATPRIMLFTLPPLAVLCLLFLGARAIGILFNGNPDSRNPLTAWAGFIGIGVLFLLNLVMLDSGSQAASLSSVVLDLDLLLLVFLATLVLCAQFVLPVESLEDRWSAIQRLVGHVLGERGPVTYIREGKAIQAHGEDRRRGPGVFLVDHASAVVLRTDTSFTRAAGPGVVFSRAGERLAEAVDLRRQERSLGPEEPASNGKDRQRTMTSTAVTRDGINVSARIGVTFMIDPGHRREPREGRDPEKPPYEYHAQSVERAVFGHMYGQYEDVSWDELPLLLVSDLWREEIKHWSLNQLLTDHEGEQPALERIGERMLIRLTPGLENKPVEAHAAEGDALESDILFSRGIRVLELEVNSLKVPQDVQRERLLQWRETWYGETQAALQEAREALEGHRKQGETKAVLLMLRNLPVDLEHILAQGDKPGTRESLASLLHGAISLCKAEGVVSGASHLVPRFEQMLEELERLDADCRDRDT